MSDLRSRVVNAIEAIEILKSQRNRKIHKTSQETSPKALQEALQDDIIEQEIDGLDYSFERAVKAISTDPIILYRACCKEEKDDIINNRRLSENPNTKTESKWFWIGIEEARRFQQKNFDSRRTDAYDYIMVLTFSSSLSSYIHILDSNLDQCGQGYSISQEHYKYLRDATVIG